MGRIGTPLTLNGITDGEWLCTTAVAVFEDFHFIGLYSGGLDDARPARDLLADELAHALGLAARGGEPLLGEKIAHAGILERGVDVFIQPRNDGGRRSGRGEGAVP